MKELLECGPCVLASANTGFCQHQYQPYCRVEEGSAGWGTYLNAAQTIKEQGLLQENPFWKVGGLVWSEPFDHPFFIKHPFCHASGMHSVIYSSFSSNHPG